MGRSIPSFRQLIEIERLNWSEFKKELPSKNDRQAFDLIFENAKLYTSYLSNACNPIPLDSIIMGTLFHNHKLLSTLDDKEKRKVIDSNLSPDLAFQCNSKTKGEDILFDKTCEKWKDLICALHEEDRELLLNMYSDICRNDGNHSFTYSSKDSKLNSFLYFYFITLLHHQKKIKEIKGET